MKCRGSQAKSEALIVAVFGFTFLVVVENSNGRWQTWPFSASRRSNLAV